MDEIRRVVVIGTGNVASNLVSALYDSGICVAQIYGRDPEKAKRVAELCGAQATSDLSKIIIDADLYIIAINDDAIGELISKLSLEGGLLVHCSATVNMQVLATASNRIGVFYPFQTFVKDRKLEFDNIPICIEANNEEDEQFLEDIASRISSRVLRINSVQRSYLHIAGIFASNFVNFNLLIASEILSDQGLAPDLLDPLLKETMDKVLVLDPVDAQTGPARRNDMKTVMKHLEILSNYPDYKSIYQMISNAINRKYK